MAHLPPLARFVELARGVDFVPVYRELLSDALSPVQAFARLDRGDAAGLFESVIGGEKVGRYSFVASDPFLLLEARGTNVTIRRRGASAAPRQLDAREATRRRQSARDAAPRSAGGPRRPPARAAAVHRRRRRLRRLRHGALRRAPAQRPARRSRPARSGVRAVRPHGRVRQRAQDRARHRAGRRARRRRRRRADDRYAPGRVPPRRRASSTRSTSPTTVSRSPTSTPAATCGSTISSNFTQAEFEAAVRKCVEYIRAGDIFQVVISQRLDVAFDAAAVRAVPHAAGGEPQPVHVLPADAGRRRSSAARRRSWSASSTAR